MERKIVKILIFAGFYVSLYYFLLLLHLKSLEIFVYFPLLIAAFSKKHLENYERGFAGAIGVIMAKGVELKLLSGYTLLEAVLVWLGGYVTGFKRMIASFVSPATFFIYLLINGVEFWKALLGYMITGVILYILLGKGGDSR
ncbi:MAG: hypothetical protein J7L34_05560 [Thermotogaceae bacterium]|nr:hypothetical protein [Thermotogaceae bacterium]